MRTRTKMLLIAAALLIIAGLWTWRFVTLNAYYHGLAGDQSEDKEYAMGDIVPMEYAGRPSGYSIRVDSFELAEYEDIDPDIFAETYAARNGIEGKIALLHITLFNIESEGVFGLESLRLRGDDTVITVESVLLKGLNPSLNGQTDVSLSKGDSTSFVVPLLIYKAQIPAAWNRLDRYSLYMIVTTNSDIRLQ